MKNQLFLFCCFCLLAFQTQAQFKYNDLTDTQKQQVKAIETTYNTATGQQAAVTYNEYMLEIVLARAEKQLLPLVDIDVITIEENSGNYFLKLHHNGGWEYDGFYNLQSREKGENVKAALLQLITVLDFFNESDMYDICLSARLLKTSRDNENFYDFEFRMLRLAGVIDINNADDIELITKMAFLWESHYKQLECRTATPIYPKGSILRQLARADGEDAFELVLDNYGFDPNISDRDGCSVLDYLNTQIMATNNYAPTATERFKKYRKILLEYGAKTANEICGCTKC